MLNLCWVHIPWNRVCHTCVRIWVENMNMRSETWGDPADHKGDYSCIVGISLTFTPRKEFASYPRGNHCKCLLAFVTSIILHNFTKTKRNFQCPSPGTRKQNLLEPMCLFVFWSFFFFNVFENVYCFYSIFSRHSYFMLNTRLSYLVISKGKRNI